MAGHRKILRLGTVSAASFLLYLVPSPLLALAQTISTGDPAVHKPADGKAAESDKPTPTAPPPTKPPAGLEFPKAPDIDAFAKAVPNCVGASNLAALERCNSDLEKYRHASEDYNEAVQRYAHQLVRFDVRVEKRHASGALKDDDYEDLHDRIASELSDATKLTGLYLRHYKDAVETYKSIQAILARDIERCRVTLTCAYSGGS